MRERGHHIVVVFLLIYTAIFYDMVDHIPLIRLVQQGLTVLIFSAWLFSLWRRGIGWPTTRLDWPLWLWLGALVISACQAREPRVGLEAVWDYVVMVLAFYLFVDLIHQGRQHWLLEAVFLFAGVLVLVSLLETAAWYLGVPFVPRFVQGWPEIGGWTIPPRIHHAQLLLSNENTTAVYCVILFPITAGWALTTRQRDVRIGLGTLTVGVLAIALLSQSRGAILGIIVTTVLGAFWMIVRRVVFPRLSQGHWMAQSPLLLVVAVITCTIVLSAGAIAYVLVSESDIRRLDLWYSAIRMFEDHPWLGAGPYHFGSTRYWYPSYERSSLLSVADHVHNIPLHLLAEGGVTVFAIAIWILVRFARIWWRTWKNVPAKTRYRLEVIAIMIAAFLVHNSVDAFLRMRPMVIVVVLAAYVVAHHEKPNKSGRRSAVLLTLSAAILIGASIGFIPIYRGMFLHQDARALATHGDYAAALETIRDAQAADPWMDLYRLEEAHILGKAAVDSADFDLTTAIESHRKALDINPKWDVGWHNLAALYARAGQYADAVEAEQHAVALVPINAGYHLSLGMYYEQLGQPEATRAAYYDALELAPWLASSGFWTDPDAPRHRGDVIDSAINHFAAERVELALSIAMYAGDFERSTAIYHTIEEPSKNLRDKIEVVWGEEHCYPCYFVPKSLLQVEQALQQVPNNIDLDIEREVKRALFISEGSAAWGRYILARYDNSLDADEINDLLIRAVPNPGGMDRFSRVFYDIDSDIDVLPEAQSPLQSPYIYEPWTVLAGRLVEAEEWDDARHVFELILERDPYDWETRQELKHLLEVAGSELKRNDTR